jgi:uncharacterized pyridoxal phosphate-containing UPF0001 family protein
MTEDEKILNILDLMGAVSPETAVTTEQMIDKAIEEGATMVRVGTGIFGERDYTI